MAQMKEQIKPPEKERYEMEIANLLGAELKKTVIRILREITDLDQKDEINIQPEQNEETRIQKNEKRLRNLWDNLSVPISES